MEGQKGLEFTAAQGPSSSFSTDPYVSVVRIRGRRILAPVVSLLLRHLCAKHFLFVLVQLQIVYVCVVLCRKTRLTDRHNFIFF